MATSSSRRNHYTIRAIPTKVQGHKSCGLPDDWHEYDSLLEARMARLLIQQKIPFTPHVKFQCFNREGKRFEYTVDFLLRSPQKFVGISPIVTALEVKGRLRKKDILRNDALDYCHKVKCWIVLEPHIEMWETEGLFWNTPDF